MAVKCCFVVSVAMLEREQEDDRISFQETMTPRARIGSMDTTIGRFLCILVSLYGLKFWCTLATSSETLTGFQRYFDISRQR